MAIKGEVFRFLVGGTINTFAALAVYYVLQLFLHYQVAYALAWVFGVILSYRINVGYVFKTSHTPAKALAFPLVHVAQYIVGALLLYVLVEKLGAPQEIAPLAVAVLLVPMTFTLTRLIVRSR